MNATLATSVQTNSTDPRSSKSSLRRNEACQQCRRKKMKCDGERPCTPCSKAYCLERKRTSMHVEIAPLNCTYDELQEIKRSAPDGSKSKYKRLEKRIEELEELVRNLDANEPVTQESFVTLGVSVRSRETPDWIENLPDRASLIKLVNIFFKSHPHPRRMFHQQTFLNSLTLPANHPDFPQPVILHAVCAVVGMMTDDVPHPQRPNFADRPDDVLFPRNYQRRYHLQNSFGEQQAHFASVELDKWENDEKHYLDCLRAATILTCHYHSYAKLYDTYLLSGRAARISSLLGLNQNISQNLSSLIRDRKTNAELVIEEESQRNSFWLMYAQERLFSTGSAWPMCIDDDDVMQLLPLPQEFFNQGISISRKERQWNNSADVLTRHPPGLTDPFILYIKSSILVSKVKKFLSRQHALVLKANTENINAPFHDLRETPEFRTLDTLISNFVVHFPKEPSLRWTGDAAEVHLYLALLVPRIAVILLHLPHINADLRDCVSSSKVMDAALIAIELFRSAWESTARNLMMSATFTMYALFMVGKTIITFSQARRRGHDANQYDTDTTFIILALSQIGERSPLAHRYAKVLQNQAGLA